MKTKLGFTLVELLIVIAIVAVLAAIAVPGYNRQVEKTRRSDAMTALTHAASMQERFYMRNNTYTGNVNDLGGVGGTLNSPEGYYTVSVDNTSCPNSQPNGSCFTLTATAAGVQANDTHCATFTLTDTGAKSATNNDCW